MSSAIKSAEWSQADINIGPSSSEDPVSDAGLTEGRWTVAAFVENVLGSWRLRDAAIRRVDLIKSSRASEGYHEAIMLHVFDYWGPAKPYDPPSAENHSFRIILERGGAFRPESNGATSSDPAQLPTAAVTKASLLINAGEASDTVTVSRIPLAPMDDPLPKARAESGDRIIRTLQLLDWRFYFRPDGGKLMRKARRARLERGELPENRATYEEMLLGLDYNEVIDRKVIDPLWPTLGPLCKQLEADSSDPDHYREYRLFATNCYFFARSIFLSMDYAWQDQWLERYEQYGERMPWPLRGSWPVFEGTGTRDVSMAQKAALWIVGKLAKTGLGENLGDVIEQQARRMAQAMADCSIFWGTLPEPLAD